MNKLGATSILFLVLVTAACTHHYTPNPNTFKSDPIADFEPTGEVTIVNAQTSSADYLYVSAGVHDHYGKLNEWTDAAIVIAQKELESRGMMMAPEANKTLSMSITRANAIFGFWVIRGEISLMVKTGDGYRNTFFVENRSPANLHRAVDGAVMRAVVAALNDKNITDYLEK